MYEYYYGKLFPGRIFSQEELSSTFNATARDRRTEFNQHLEKDKVIVWVDKALYEIFNTVSKQLTEENFRLQTHDGIEFVLSGS